MFFLQIDTSTSCFNNDNIVNSQAHGKWSDVEHHIREYKRALSEILVDYTSVYPELLQPQGNSNNYLYVRLQVFMDGGVSAHRMILTNHLSKSI